MSAVVSGGKRIMRDGVSMGGLVREFSDLTKTFIREEVHLAKAEVSEKFSGLLKNSTNIVIGGVVAYAGLVVLLGGLGLLLAYGFQRLGMEALLAGFAGLGIIGFTVIAVGGVLILKAVNSLKKHPLVPEKTMHTLQHLQGQQPHHEEAETKRQKEPTSGQIEASVMETEDKMAQIMGELGDRMRLTNLGSQASREVSRHPYRYGLIALGIGAGTTFWIKRKLPR